MFQASFSQVPFPFEENGKSTCGERKIVWRRLENRLAQIGKSFGADWKIVWRRLENRLAQIGKSFGAGRLTGSCMKGNWKKRLRHSVPNMLYDRDLPCMLKDEGCFWKFPWGCVKIGCIFRRIPVQHFRWYPFTPQSVFSIVGKVNTSFLDFLPIKKI